jgi:hypothetical protein
MTAEPTRSCLPAFGAGARPSSGLTTPAGKGVDRTGPRIVFGLFLELVPLPARRELVRVTDRLERAIRVGQYPAVTLPVTRADE